MYDDLLVEHFVNPRNIGTIDNPDGYGKAGEANCGDMIETYIKVEDGLIMDIKTRVFGCSVAIACGSMTTELAKGKPDKVAAQLTDEQVAEALGGLAKAKLHCSGMAATALQAAISNYRESHSESEMRAEASGVR